MGGRVGDMRKPWGLASTHPGTCCLCVGRIGRDVRVGLRGGDLTLLLTGRRQELAEAEAGRHHNLLVWGCCIERAFSTLFQLC